MLLTELLEKLTEHQVKIWLEKGKLKFFSKNNKLSLELKREFKNAIIQHKESIINLLKTDNNTNKNLKSTLQTNYDTFIPLSYAQQQLWYIQEAMPESTHYHIAAAYRLNGNLNIQALTQGLHAIYQRHAVYRTSFKNSSVGLQQVIHNIEPLTHTFNIIESVDLQHLDHDKQLFIAKQLCHQMINSPFNLQNPPLIKIKLIQLDKNDFIFIMVKHHLIADADSLQIFYNELSELYNSYNSNRPYSLPNINIQYADFSLWERQYITPSLIEQEVSFWKESLLDFNSTEIQTDFSRPQTLTHSGLHIRRSLTQSQLDFLVKIAAETSSTLNIVTLSIFTILLFHYTGEDDITLGTSVSNRNQVPNPNEIQNIIGLFINTLPLRIKLFNNSIFNEVVLKIRETYVNFLNHKNFPLELIKKSISIPRDPSRNPIFQIFFEYQSALPSLQLDSINVATFDVAQNSAKFDLCLTVFEEKYKDTRIKGLSLDFEYNSDLFCSDTMHFFADCYMNLIEILADQPGVKIDAIHLVSNEIQQKFLLSNKCFPAHWQNFKSITQLFNEQTLITPQAIAVIDEKNNFSFQEIYQKANQLKAIIQKKMVTQEQPILVLMDRGHQYLVSLLAIWKANCFLVPLNPLHPIENNRRLLDAMDRPILITSQPHKIYADLLVDESQIIVFERINDENETLPSNNTDSAILPKSLAYIIFTSGSSGIPKGAMIQHDGLYNHIINKIIDLKLTNKDHVAQIATQTFDVSIWQFIAVLLVGGKVTIFNENNAWSPEQLLTKLTLDKITILESVPTHLLAILEELEHYPGRYDLNNLKYLIMNGEPLNVELCHRWFRLYPHIPIINAYGPTECSDDVTHHSFTHIPHTYKSIVPINGTLANIQLHILNNQLNPVPPGVIGELYIGGIGVGRGYLEDPIKTSLNFIPNPFSSEPGSRLYKTGDFVTYNCAGEIFFMFRSDQQIKIRGFRIELGEIETRLINHPAVAECAATYTVKDNNSKHLVAYIIKKPRYLPLSEKTLKRFLLETLPDYMVPNTFIFIKKMPLTTSGKLDRNSLQKASYQKNIKEATQISYSPPTTYEEIQLVRIWAELLKLDANHLSIDSNFFELGGDSIISMQMITRAKQAAIQLTPKLIFQYQTISDLANAATKNTHKKNMPHAKQEPIVGEIKLTPIQLQFFNQYANDPHHYNQANILTINQDINLNDMKQVIEILVQHHDALRIKFWRQFDTSNWVQFNHPITTKNDYYDIHYQDLSLLPTIEKTNFIENHTSQLQKKLNIETGPILQVSLYRIKNKTTALFITAHHLYIDAVSWHILLEDLKQLYRQISQQQPSKLALKTTEWQYWSDALYRLSQDPLLEQEILFWTQQQSMPQIEQLNMLGCDLLSLPQDILNSNRYQDIASVTITLDKKTTQALLKKTSFAYSTQINDILLSALLISFSKFNSINAGSFALPIALEGHGRESIFPEIDLSRTIGWFTHIFSLLLNSSHINDFSVTIKSIKEQLRNVPNKGIGYGILKYLVQKPEITSTLLLNQPLICFNYLGQLDNTLYNDGFYQPCQFSINQNESPNLSRAYVLEVDGWITNQQLTFKWAYSKLIHSHASINKLTKIFLRTLNAIISHCLQPNVGTFTPTDFPLSNTTIEQLDNILYSLKKQLAKISASEKNIKKQLVDIYPLTPLQQGMLFHKLYNPDSSEYFVQLVMKINGNLNLDSWHQAWLLTLHQYPPLQTGFIYNQIAKPLQFVMKNINPAWVYHDWSSFTETEKEEQLNNYLRLDKQQGFNLLQPPLIRFALFRLNLRSYQFIVSNHHIILDGWSLPIMFHAVMNKYYSLIAQTPPPTTKSRPYRDYIAWLISNDLTSTENYWRALLHRLVNVTRLNIDKFITSKQKETDPKSLYHYQHCESKISRTLSQQLQDFSQTHQLTLNTITQGVFAMLLAWYSGDDDIIFGTTVSGRPVELNDSDAMVGLFINTLPFRIKINHTESVLQFLQTIQNQTLASRDYQYTPLVKIQSWHKNSQEKGLFNYLWVFENYPSHQDLTQYKTHIHQTKEQEVINVSEFKAIESTHYPLTFITSFTDQLHLKIIYNTARFDEDYIKSLLKHYENLLIKFINFPKKPIVQLPVLSSEETFNLLNDWSGYEKSLPHIENLATIPDYFAKQVQQNPQGIALQYQNLQLTYQQLDKKTNQLAHYLRHHGIGPETVVALCLERSQELIIAIISILKAGGAYLPIDPHLPENRITFILEDSESKIIITTSNLKNIFPNISHTSLIFLDLLTDTLNETTDVALLPLTKPHHLAYIIYTSGSTGQPKGVLIEHRQVVRLFIKANDLYHFNAKDVWTLFHSYAFDVSVWEMWGALFFGGKLIIVPYWISRSPDKFYQLMIDQQVTILSQTPTAFYQIIEADNKKNSSCHYPDKFLALRYIILAGECLQLYNLQDWFKKHGEHNSWVNKPTIVNMYGITEATVHVTTRTITQQDLHIARENPNLQSPIGKPLSDLYVYVLNQWRLPVPPGITGELYVGGAGIARGYLFRTQLNEERFITNPFVADSNSKLYKTGDLVCWSTEGELYYKNRIDSQIKLRGYRIELGEIENTLLRHPQIKQATCIVRNDNHGYQHLLAYFISKSEQIVNKTQLRNFLSLELPSYMIPAQNRLFQITEFPLTHNGKLDEDKLTLTKEVLLTVNNLPVKNISSKNNYSYLTMNAAEKIIADIWIDLLNVDRNKITVIDNFFELGGDSIICLQVVSRCQQKNLFFSVKQLFDHPTIQAIAKIAESNPQHHETQRFKKSPPSKTNNIPLTPIQHWFFEKFTFNPHHFNQAYTFILPNHIDVEIFPTIIEKLIQHHDVFRTRFIKSGVSWQQSIRPYHAQSVKSYYRWRLFDFNQYAIKTQKIKITHANQQSQRCFNLTHGPMLAINCFKGKDSQPAKITFIIHHLIIDNVSWRILLEDLVSLLLEREPLNLSIPSSSYPTWARSCQQWAHSKEIMKQTSYWLSVLDPLSNNSNSQILDYPQRLNQLSTLNCSKSTRIILGQLSKKDTLILLKTVPKTLHTKMNDNLLTALLLAFNQVKGINNLLLHLEGHGRENSNADLDLTNTIGWFTSIFPVLLQKNADRDLLVQLHTIKQQLCDIPRKGVGYGLLRHLNTGKAGQSIRKLNHLFGDPYILFNYLGQIDTTLKNDFFIPSNDNSELGDTQDPQQQKAYLLEIDIKIINQQLISEWHYCKHYFSLSTINDLSHAFLNHLRAIIKLSTRALPPPQKSRPEELSQSDHLEKLYPLTPLQKGMIFHRLFDDKRSDYLVQVDMQIAGNLNIDSFYSAWQYCIQQYNVLRSAFCGLENEEPSQYILKTISIPWQFIDIRKLDKKDQHEFIIDVLNQDRKQNFQLTVAPLFRLILIQMTNHQYRFVFSHHHILLDGWSVTNLLHSVFASYKAKNSSKLSFIDHTDAYENYIAWLQQQSQDAARRYWVALLSNYQSNMSTYKSSPSSFLTSHTTSSFMHRLTNCAKNLKITLNVLMQSVFGLLLCAHSQCDDLVLGIVTSGRSEKVANFEQLVGLFINTLPMRIKITNSQLFSKFVSLMQSQFIASREFEYYQFAELKRYCSWEANKSLINYLFVFENYPISTLDQHSTTTKPQSISINALQSHESTHYALCCMIERERNISIKFNFNTTLYRQTEVRQLLARYIKLLRLVISNKNIDINQLLSNCASKKHDATQQAIAKVWSDILKINEHQIIDTSDFLSLGGHSLLAIRVISRINKLFEIQMPIRILFESNLQECAAYIDQTRRHST